MARQQSGRGSEFLSVRETADLLNVHVATVRRWIASGKLPAYRLGDKSVRISSSDATALLIPFERQEEVDGGTPRRSPPEIPRLTLEEQTRALAAIESARKFRARLRAKYGEGLPSAELLHDARREREYP